jgi:sulfate/thiosulfate transport system substrate-binding protein
VALVEGVARRQHTEAVATAYLQFLFTDESQEIAARHHFRPTSAKVLARSRDRFPAIPLTTIEQLGGWPAVQAKHFADGGIFDQIYQPKK